MRSQFDETSSPLRAAKARDIDDVRTTVKRLSDRQYSPLMTASLTEREMGDLLALIWIARGVYAPAEWDDARFEGYAAGDIRNVDTLLRHPYFWHWLREGLTKLEEAVLVSTLH